MKLIRLLIGLMMLVPVQTFAQEEGEQVGRHEGADSTVLMVPYRELVMQRLDALVDDSLMERAQLGLMVWDLTDDTLLYALNHRQLMRTASTMKLLTAITALDYLGPTYKYKTSLYYRGQISNGQLTGDLICRGGMDPMFDRKDMLAFAQAVKDKGIKSIRGRIIMDSSMKDGEKWGEGWCWDDDNPTLSPLLINGKADFSTQFMIELRGARVSTGGVSVASGSLPNDAKLICQRSHPIGDVLKQMMKESDNLYAESTYYQIAASSGGRPATAKDAQKLEENLLVRIGLDPSRYRLADGSGLSLYNYLTAEAQVRLLRYAWFRDEIYQQLLPTLPIAGEDGTLKKRMTDTAAQGNVQAKTGSVTGVSALTGYLTAPNGHRLAFSIINQGVRRMAEGRDFQDRLCEALCQP